MKTLREKMQEARSLDRLEALQKRRDENWTLSSSERGELRRLSRQLRKPHDMGLDEFARFVVGTYSGIETALRTSDNARIREHRFVHAGRRGNASWIGQIAADRFSLGAGVKSLHSRVLKALTDAGLSMSPGVERKPILKGTGRPAPEPWSEKL